VTSGCFLAARGDFDGQLNGFLERIPSSRVHRFDGLNIHVCNYKIICLKIESRSFAENGATNNIGRGLVEIVESLLCNVPADTRGDGFSEISDKIGNGEELGGTFLGILVYFEEPIIA